MYSKFVISLNLIVNPFWGSDPLFLFFNLNWTFTLFIDTIGILKKALKLYKFFFTKTPIKARTMPTSHIIMHTFGMWMEVNCR